MSYRETQQQAATESGMHTLDMLDLRSLCSSCLVLVVPPGIILALGSQVLHVGPAFLGMHGL